MTTGSSNLSDVLGRRAVHPVPARMAPSLALDALAELPDAAVVLDPMVGSGTVVAVARAHGHRGIGFDVDPLAALIARVWTSTVDATAIRRAASRCLRDARAQVRGLRARDAYPNEADDETMAFVRYWFDECVRRQLTALANTIQRVEETSTREVLWCAFSRQIIAKQAGVSLALDLAHSRPHRAFTSGPRKPFSLFLDAVERVLSGCLSIRDRSRGPRARVEVGDARRLPLRAKSVDLVVTSPPYLNAIDYLRCSKFSLVWMGHSISALRDVRSGSIGTEVGAKSNDRNDGVLADLMRGERLTPRMEGVLRRYIDDTEVALREVSRVLVSGGKAVYVVGENTIRGTFIPTGVLVSRLAHDAGLELKRKRLRELPGNRRYLPPPGSGRAAMDTRMRREVVLTFQK